ncbi:RagB/SusD family nutrient uptake outer membrane protein [Sphingobacterium humi]|uniref:RagB/SusD family nutrient uptake outer membrane protein n=1 Tax=Sphingobacterium humi TaxID=1796905 RepID=A0A6N8KUX4_9SPHI|nr:RagB/SusD family nutrient uptake outer membrane protein [Sphingobacterium humi]MVZ60876.1 RagB/SusD family nutrient uptake outer membrane protein [Sphingobacterium humi]
MATFKLKYLLLLSLPFFTSGCKSFLAEEVYTEYDPNGFLQDASGIDALLTGAYARSRIIAYDHRNYTYMMNEFNTDVSFETGGGLEKDAAPFIQFNWAVNNSFLNGFWQKMYQAIASANSVLLLSNQLGGLDQEKLNKIQAEARFIRGSSYYFLYNLFGPTPLIDIPADATPEQIEEIGKNTARATREVFVNYVVADLEFAAQYLPLAENPIGRASKGAAYGYLMKLYLKEKNWAKIAEVTKQVIDGKQYELYADYTKLFNVLGESNKEFIFRAPCLPQSGYHNNYMAHAFPPNYPILSNQINFGAQFRTYSAFYKTFDANDRRRELLIRSYTDVSGKNVELLEDAAGKALDNVRSFKYWPDPNAVGEAMGNDIVYIRYADILLSRAEALNELSGPTQEAIDLINAVRQRANAATLTLASYPTKEGLRDFLLAERGREFYSEGLRREDLIRHGKFISSARSRGYAAKDHQVLYPIPLQQIDANPNLEQNDGY